MGSRKKKSESGKNLYLSLNINDRIALKMHYQCVESATLLDLMTMRPYDRELRSTNTVKNNIMDGYRWIHKRLSI